MQIISFASFDGHILQIFVGLKIIKFLDLVVIFFCNCSFIYEHFLLASLPQLVYIFSFSHLILMNKTLGQYHMIF